MTQRVRLGRVVRRGGVRLITRGDDVGCWKGTKGLIVANSREEVLACDMNYLTFQD